MSAVAPVPGRPLPSHPRAARALVLGIVGLAGGFVLLVPLALSPVAWYLGASAQRAVDREPERWSGRSDATAGLVLGIVGTVVLVGAALVLSALTALVVVGSSVDTGYGS
ncbi:MAG: DUF4190 domain-containing protein [Aeromicrobium erythreum]